MAARTPYPISGTVTSPDGTAVDGGTVKIVYNGDPLTATTNSSGQYIKDLANLPEGNDYADTVRFLITAYDSTHKYFYTTTKTVDLTAGKLELDIVLEPVKKTNMHMLVQKVVWKLLQADTTLDYWIPSNHIIDQIPPAMMKGAGFPYIIVHTPTITEEPLTLGPSRKVENTIRIKIETYDKKQINIRRIADAIKNTLSTNQATTKATLIYWMRLASESLRSHYLPDEKTYPVWLMTQEFEFRWFG